MVVSVKASLLLVHLPPPPLLPRLLTQLAVHIPRRHNLDFPPHLPRRVPRHYPHLLRLLRVHGPGAHLLRVLYHLPSHEWEGMRCR